VRFVHQLGKDGIHYPTEHPAPDNETFFTTRAVHTRCLYDSIDLVLDDPCWGRMRQHLRHTMRSKDITEACVGRVLAYTDPDLNDAVIFEYRVITREDRRGQPDGLIHSRTGRIAL